MSYDPETIKKKVSERIADLGAQELAKAAEEQVRKDKTLRQEQVASQIVDMVRRDAVTVAKMLIEAGHKPNIKLKTYVAKTRRGGILRTTINYITQEPFGQDAWVVSEKIKLKTVRDGGAYSEYTKQIFDGSDGIALLPNGSLIAISRGSQDGSTYETAGDNLSDSSIVAPERITTASVEAQPALLEWRNNFTELAARILSE
jgi:hypothetical protein